MGPLKLDRLIRAIENNSKVKWAGSDLLVPQKPSPYIPPKFRIISSNGLGSKTEEKLSVEVIIIQAPAAVGKSVTARHISSLRNTPVLDLAVTAVGANSLRGSILGEAEFSGKLDPTKALGYFHNGQLPVIVDALDESLMVSGSNSFESFLQSTAELILSDRSVVDKPKIVFFGRPEAASDSDTWVALVGENQITTCVIELEFFEKSEAVSLIKAYAEQTILLDETKSESEKRKRIAELRQNRSSQNSPIDDLILQYFDQLESALKISSAGSNIASKETLWTNPVGKAFAGYAPVLSSIGRLLAAIKNPANAIQELNRSDGKSAWSVIESVMQYILVRERDKVVEPLQKAYGEALEAEVLKVAYEPREQLTHLAQHLQGKTISDTGRVRFPIADHNNEYISNVRTFVREHPFVRNREAVNDVFASVIIANAIRFELLEEEFSQLTLASLSRYPFLWRCFWHQMTESIVKENLDGKYVGFLLRSYCSDPLSHNNEEIQITGTDNEVKVLCSSEQGGILFEFSARPPIVLFGDVRNCEIEANNFEIIVVGDAKNDARVFRFQGKNIIDSAKAQFHADLVVVDDHLWINVRDNFTQDRIPTLRVPEGKSLKASGAICGRDPWSNYAVVKSSADTPKLDDSEMEIVSIIEQAIVKGVRGKSYYTNDRFELDDQDLTIKWLRRSWACEGFLRTLVGSKCANRAPDDTSGTYNQKIILRVEWQDMLDQRVKSVGDKRILEFWSRWRKSAK